MSASSGQNVSTVSVDVECTGCTFAGEVDASYDPEVSRDEVRWTCPACSTDNTEERE